MPLLAVKKLKRTYNENSDPINVLHDVSLEINAGETIAIVGKSGSGKSTLMHLMALLDRPTSGELYIDTTEVSSLEEAELNTIRNKRFGFVFQQFFLNGHASVLDNVIMPLTITGIERSERERRGREVLEDVDLADKALSKALELSGGQKQRVCIARALVNHPDIIFCDEPTGNLDSATGAKITKQLFDLNHTRGITLIIVTHDLDLARQCKRRIYIKDGTISQEA